MLNEFRVIIVGFENYELLRDYCDYFLRNKLSDPNLKIIIVSGAEDSLGDRYAAERGLPIERFTANWEKYGKRAGYLRNIKMAEVGNALIAFRSAYALNRGIDMMIDIARKKHLLVREITEEA